MPEEATYNKKKFVRYKEGAELYSMCQKKFERIAHDANAVYKRSSSGGGSWEYKKKVPSAWQVKYKNLTFNIKPMGFKHTGLFPEQAVNWDWMIEKIKKAGR